MYRQRNGPFANCAEIRFYLKHPQGDDDGTLYLDAEVGELADDRITLTMPASEAIGAVDEEAAG